MSDDTPPRERFDDADRAFVAAADSTGAQVIAAHGMMTALQAQIDALIARVAKLEAAATTLDPLAGEENG